MKKSVSSLLIASLLCSSLVAHSTVLRVNNTPSINVPYATVQAAYTAAVNGDTIYLEGTIYDYGTLSLYKRLVIIGTGYFLGQNPETQANINPSTISTIYCYTGSSGSKFIGLNITSQLYFINTLQDFVVTRNNINSLTSGAGVSNCYFTQNMIAGVSGQFLSTLFSNNFLNSLSVNSNNNSLFINNNVLVTAYVTMAQCRNNIMYGTGSFSNCELFNNVCSSTQMPAGNGNQLNINMNDVFVCYSNCTGFSTDGRYQLKAGSPALGAGSNGEDCGMFGGTDPYILSGMPPIPAIYYFNYNFNSSTINVDMKVKSHN
jgi:hypothetical protein